jgi:hypothetical protein
MEFPKFLEDFVTEEADRQSVMDGLEQLFGAAVKVETNDYETRISALEANNRALKQEKTAEVEKRRKREAEYTEKLDILTKSNYNVKEGDVQERLALVDLQSKINALESENSDLKLTNEGLVAESSKTLYSTTIKNLLAEHGINQRSFQDALTAKFQNQSKVDSQSKKVFFGEGDSSREAKDFIAEWVKSDEAKPFVDVTLSSGGGANGARSSGGKDTKDMTITEKMAFYKKNPDRVRSEFSR